ncbi:MAG TPA: hypothetical protein ENJ95_02895 [Bacteroidetes bacterium]|nr:hypothetical protein [Bacteroidota bacterium]
MKSFCALLPFIFLFGHTGTAQDYFTLTGKVLDKKNNKPVAYAHVGIPEKGIGTTTGHDGGFEFKVPNRYAGSVMIVSFMGYRTFKKPIKEIKNGGTIYIEQAASDLVEVVVMGENAVEDIIRKAVKNIPVNYPSHPTTVLGFYRESLTDDSLRYRYLAEGVLKIYKTKYAKISEGQVSLVQGRKINLKNPLDTTVYSGLSSGHMAGHRFDFVKNREDFIDENFFPVYKYWVEKITTYNDRPVYIIGFDKDENASPRNRRSSKWKALAHALTGKKKNNGRIAGRMKGKIYIEQGSYAFIRAEFEILPEGLNKMNDYPLYAGSWRGNKYVVNYRKVGDKWYFSDALREGIRPNGGLYANEIKITEINTERSSPIPYLERMDRGYQFVNLTGSYDESFWKSYNTTPLNEGLAESVHQYKNIQKAQEVFDAKYMAGLQRQRDSIQALAVMEMKVKMAEEKGVDISEIDYVPEEFKKISKIRKKFSRVKFGMGTGMHLLPTKHGDLDIVYLNKDGETILSLTDDIPDREMEIIGQWDFDIFFSNNFFMRFGYGFDFSKNIYKERSIGAGLQLNLSKGRPVYFRALAQYSYLRHARVVGNTKNEDGDFKVKGKKFKANSIRISYGSQLHNIKLSAELAIELNPGKELYFRGGYFWNFANQERIWFKERKEVFRKEKSLKVSSERISVKDMGLPFNDKIVPDETISITVGLLFK